MKKLPTASLHIYDQALLDLEQHVHSMGRGGEVRNSISSYGLPQPNEDNNNDSLTSKYISEMSYNAEGM